MLGFTGGFGIPGSDFLVWCVFGWGFGFCWFVVLSGW